MSMPVKSFRASLHGLACAMVAGLGLLAQPTPQDLHTPEGQYGFAEALFFRKFYDLAEKEYGAFAERFPDHALGPEASYRRILCLRHLKRDDDMVRAMDQFQAKWPAHALGARLSLWKGELLFGRQDFAGAETCFRRLSEQEDTVLREAALYFVAQCLERQGKPEDALATYQRLAGAPFDGQHEYRPYALYAVAVADQRRGQNEKAAAGFQLLSGSDHVPAVLREEASYRLAEARFALAAYADAVRGYERVLAEFPEGAFAREARKRLGWARYMMGDFRQAADTAAEWRRLYPQEHDVEVDFVQAASMVGLETYAEALPLLQRLAEDAAAPADTVRMARYQEVVCLASLKRYPEALARADAFAATYPKAGELPMVQYVAGTVCQALHDLEKAAAYLRRAEDTFVGDVPQREDAGRLLADCLLKLARPGDAAAVFRKLSARPDTKRAAYYLYKAGECERQAGNTEAAIRDFETVLKLFPQAEAETRAALQHLGELYPTAGQIGRALDIVRALLEKAPAGADRARLRFYTGYLRYQQQKYEEAVTELRAVVADPAAGTVVPPARFYLGTALLELGRRDEALDAFAEVLALPLAERPPFPVDLLLQLEALFFARNQVALSESICRWLIERDDLAVVQRAALRLAALLAAQNRFDAAAAELAGLRRRRQEALARDAALVLPADEEITSVQSELFLLQDQVPKAVVAAEQCLGCKDLGQEALTRARWVLAEALARQGHPVQALPFAVKAYILDDDPYYSPRAMVLAVRLLVGQKRLAEARTAWAELRKRYPVFAESVAGSAEVKALQAAAAPPG